MRKNKRRDKKRGGKNIDEFLMMKELTAYSDTVSELSSESV
jgi:hypothetical protein